MSLTLGRGLVGKVSKRSATFTSIDQGYSDTLGGSWRLLTGTGFTGAVAGDVRFDPLGTNTAATSIIVSSDTQIYAKVPAHAAGTVSVSVKGAILSNCIKYWDPTVPGTPTWFGDRGGYSKFTFSASPNYHWVRRAGSFNVGGIPVDMRKSVSYNGADVGVDGTPFFGEGNGDPTTVTALSPKSTTDPADGTNVTFNDLWGGASNAVGGTLLFAGYVEKIGSGGSNAFQGDGILYDGGQNRNGLLLSNITKTGVTANVIRWMVYDGSFKVVERPITTPGPFAVVAMRDVTTTPGTPFIKLTTDGVTWDGSAATTPVGNQSGWDEMLLGTNSGGGSGNFHGLGQALVFYQVQLTAQDITDFYGWWNAEFSSILFPESDDPTAWFGGSGTGYTGTPFVASKSNGLSGGRLPLITATAGINTAPTVGGAVDGFTPMVFNGTSSALQHQIVTSTNSILPPTPGPFTVMVLAYVTAAVAPGASFELDPALFTDSVGNVAISVSTSGVRGGVTAGVNSTPFIAQPIGQWFVAWLRYDGSTLDLRVNLTDAAGTAAVGHGAFAVPFYVGRNFNGAKYLNGMEMEHRAWYRRLSNSECLAHHNALKAKYPSMGLL